MYKLLLVDDEEEVRQGIVKKIEWEKYGFELVGEAENGREALEIAEKVMPDVVITDIKMPFMDGIKLSQELRKSIPTTKIVILTGFDEFEYAQKAINLRVIEYALKPISSDELIDILLRLKTQLDEEISEKENTELLRAHYTKSLPILKEKFFSSLITNSLEKDEIYEKCKNYDIKLAGNFFTVAVISIDDSILKGKHRYKFGEEAELIIYAVLNVVTEIGFMHDIHNIFIHNDRIVLIISAEEEKAETVIREMLSILEEIRQSIEKYLMLEVTIGLGTMETDTSMISNSWVNAMAALDYRLILGSNRIIWIEDIEPGSKDKIIFDKNMEHEMESSIKVGTEVEVSETIDRMFDKLTDTKASFKDYQIYLLEMLTAILKAAQSSNVDLASIFGRDYNIFVELYSFNDLKHVKTWLKEISLKIMSHIMKDRKDTCELLIEKAKDYIHRNYSDSELNINDLCNHLHISQTYFSLLFKKETKMTFINYLTSIRMDEAKQLLKTTDMKTFEVARKVGYSEPNYFSYSFKRYLGMSPSEYRSGKTS
ncbi:response regulator [Clostridium cellulovorans]|uniref:Stage 0 sporulation protein A homolog n=1 Tax=Clostridium cellulovorans (strain ATCC 35296 / DSM 3052 / OCM 3 / 743B) TaxID=573061 RepID=D9SKU0_CLOC7|nr:response regulator [Clostridium cellulovorans]ADL53512.1 two component transcriptional regulator, AraC family [Clostridium cellulovorans 743B]